MQLIKFLFLLWLSFMIILLVLTILANSLGWNEYGINPLLKDCHPIMIPFNNSFFFEYPCGNAEVIK